MNDRDKKEPHLKRKVNLFALTMYGVGNILGAGIYALIGKVVGETGNFSWLSFVLAAFIGAFTGLSYAELSAMYPKSAAEFVYTENAFKIRLLSFILGWIIIFSGLFSATTVALGFAGYLAALIGIPSTLLIIPIAIGLVIVLSIVNYIGIKTSTWMNIIFTLIEASGLVFIIIIGIPHFGSVDYFQLPTTSSFFTIFSSVALIFFAYIGFEDIANIAEEVKNPTRNLPKAIIYSLAITTILYCLTAISVVSIVDYSVIAVSTEPLSTVAVAAIGPVGRFILSFIALFATANTVLIMLIVTSRMMYGMARDKALPTSLSKISKKYKTPMISVFITMVIIISMAFLGDIDIVAHATVFGVLINFILVNLSLIVLRKNKPNLPRPFKVKLNIGFVPVIALLGVIVCIGLLFTFDWITILINGFIILAGLIVFYVLKSKIETKTPKEIKDFKKMVTAALKVMVHVLNLVKDDSVLVISDEDTSSVGKAFYSAALEYGCSAQLYLLPEKGRPLSEIPPEMIELMNDKTVIINAFKGLMKETPFRVKWGKKVLATNSIRIGHGAGITASMMLDGPFAIDYEKMASIADKLILNFKDASKVEVTALGGTNITLYIENRGFSTDVRINKLPYFVNLPCGEIWCGPIETTGDGIIVCDGSIGDVGKVLNPLKMTVKNGKLIGLESEDKELVRTIEELLSIDDEARIIGELGIGLNSGAKLRGILLEDEKALQTAHIAFGNNEEMEGGKNKSKTHRDFLFYKPTMKVTYKDGTVKTLINNGEFIFN